MIGTHKSSTWRILIASSHPLFAEGLRSLLHKRKETDTVVVGVVSTIEQALKALKSLRPDLVIVDYDDEQVNRDEFLVRFVEGEGRLRVVVLSLKEGGNEAIIYDRRTMAASQIEDWLEKWNDEQAPRIQPEALLAGDKRNYPNRRQNMKNLLNSVKHLVAAGFLVILIGVVGFWALDWAFNSEKLLPKQASLQGVAIDWLFKFEFRAIVILFALIVGLMVYSIVIFRRKKGDKTDGLHMEGNTKLEVLWTIVPLGAVLYLAYLGGWALGETQAADPKPLEVNVIGSQWSWRFEYPDLGIQGTELILPVDKQALLHMSSTDVIHSFWVPEFRVKQDALPGGDKFVRDLRVTPSKVGEYKLRCAELCGRQHYAMESPVRVLNQAEFDNWVQSMLIPADPIGRGQKWWKDYACYTCHSVDGTASVGPTWKGLYGEEVSLADGSTVLADHDYLYKSIRDPGAQITAGFNNVMPPGIASPMTDEQVEDVIAFIESLK